MRAAPVKIIITQRSAAEPNGSTPAQPEDGREEEREEHDVKKVAIIVTRGAYNNLLQACEFARIAAESGVRVSVLFRDEAVARLSVEKVGTIVLSEAFKGRESKVRDMLEEEKRSDLPGLLREIKERGEAKFSVCERSLQLFEITIEKLIPELDEVQAVEAFWKEEVMTADQVMTF